MFALSVRQPWADLLFPPEGKPDEPAPKSIETRQWAYALRARARSLVGQRIAIHTGQAFSAKGGLAWLDHYADDEITEAKNPERLPRGCILGTAKLVEARMLTSRDEPATLCRIEPGTFGLVFAEPRRLKPVVPWPGELGFFEVPISVS